MLGYRREEVPSLVSRTVRGSGPSQDVLSIVLPLVQCRAPPWRHLDANPRAGPLRERRSGHCRQEIRAPRSMGRSSRTLRQRCAEAQTAPGGRLHQSSHPFPHHTGHCSLINPVECPIVVDRFRIAPNRKCGPSVAHSFFTHPPGEVSRAWPRLPRVRLGDDRVAPIHLLGLVSRQLYGHGPGDAGTRGNSDPYDGVFWLEQVRSNTPRPAFERARTEDSPENSGPCAASPTRTLHHPVKRRGED